jgi:hypothetical protein
MPFSVELCPDEHAYKKQQQKKQGHEKWRKTHTQAHDECGGGGKKRLSWQRDWLCLSFSDELMSE